MEFNFERIAMSAALFAMAGAIVAKMVTMQLIKVMRKDHRGGEPNPPGSHARPPQGSI
ncbi:MAG: hypothetical protein VX893_13735 [Candidatus Latescibacterota bacterium]|nr:hypothetical protein [Candidatus Latescibacterota bacterium]